MYNAAKAIVMVCETTGAAGEEAAEEEATSVCQSGSEKISV